ncbi:MAG TPA: hypothetical protein VG937_29845, partial [Polyangiaceae bacterium]|nr:hypothetical protein [Polyangiaceae bacterium]
MSDGSATMYYCTSRCETHKRALASVDSDSISNLYLAALEDDNTGSETPGGCGGARLAPRGALNEAALTLGSALLMLIRRRRAHASTRADAASSTRIS